MNLSKYSSITFDIFDTLVKRKVALPEDVFSLVEEELDQKFNITTNFKEKRLAAKRDISVKNRFYSISDIYTVINLSPDVSDAAQHYEKEIEIAVCFPNKKIINLLNEAASLKKQIFLISDMYLDRATMERILKKCRITAYERLYISQEEHADKVKGDLFKKVIEENRLDPRKMLHVGDNIKSDLIGAKRYGIHTYHINKKSMWGSYFSKRGLDNCEKRQYQKILHLLQEQISDVSDRWEALGYECLGPVLWGFAIWLREQLDSVSIKKVYFLAREGALLKKIFEQLYGQVFQCEYLYVSRHSLTIPSFASEKGYEDIVRKVSFPKEITVEEFLDYIGLDYNEVSCEVNSLGLHRKDEIEGWNVVHNSTLKHLFKTIEPYAKEKYKCQSELFKKYLNQNGFIGKVAIVDIGWNGTMQNALETLSCDRNVEIYGFYFGVNENNKLAPDSKAFGYIYEPGKNINYQYYIMGMSGPLEMMMTAQHGTTLGYEEKDGIVFPVLGESEYFGKNKKKESEPIKKMQRGALRFLEQMEKDKYLGKKSVKGKVAFHNFYQFGISPILRHRQMFYGMKEYDSQVELTMLDPNRKGFVGKNSILKGFWKSSWKIGYMKDKLRLPLPYERIYLVMRKKRR